MISVITCPRPGGVTYIGPLLEAIRSELPNERLFIVEDGPVLLSPPNNKFPGWKALGEAARIGEDLLYLEDDVYPIFNGALTTAMNHVPPEWAAFTSFYCGVLPVGKYPATLFKMSQAVYFPLRTLKWLLQFPTAISGDWEASIGFDMAIAAAGRGANWSYEQVDSLFNHIGIVSAAAPGYLWV